MEGGRALNSPLLRNLFASTWDKGQFYSNLNLIAPSMQPLKANLDVFAVPWAKLGFGCLAVVPLGDFGPLPDQPPLIEAHTSALADFDFHPFRRDLVVTSSINSPVKLWSLPTAGDDETIGLRHTMRDPSATLMHDCFADRRVQHVSFHPLANDLLLTANIEGALLLWDLNRTTAPKITTSTLSQAVSIAWDGTGSMLAALCQDKALRLVDPRGEAIIGCVTEAHPNAKSPKCVWLGNSDLFLTTGYGRGNERELCVWDRRQLGGGHLQRQLADTGGVGPLLPFYDPDLHLLYLAGKGDTYIRMYEMVGDAHVARYMGQAQTNSPLTGMAMFPKRVCDVLGRELARFLKLTNGRVETISFRVPKRNRNGNMFDGRLFPDTFSGDSSLEPDAWLAGAQAQPKLMSLQPEGSTAYPPEDPLAQQESDDGSSESDSNDTASVDDETDTSDASESDRDEEEEEEEEHEDEEVKEGKEEDMDEPIRPRSKPLHRVPLIQIALTGRKQGWLRKQKRGFMKKWGKRWFSLSGDQLLYSQGPGLASVGSIPLQSMLTIMWGPGNLKNVPKGKLNCCFEIFTLKRCYVLRAKTEEEAMEWVTALELARGQANNLAKDRAGAATARPEVVKPPALASQPAYPSYSEISGFLAKKPHRAIGAWKRRWFSLQSEGILLYADSENGVPLGTIHFSLVTGVQDVGTKFGSGRRKDLCFQIDTPTRVYFLQADTKKERDVWMRRLVSCLHRMRRLDTRRRARTLHLNQPSREGEQSGPSRLMAWAAGDTKLGSDTGPRTRSDRDDILYRIKSRRGSPWPSPAELFGPRSRVEANTVARASLSETGNGGGEGPNGEEKQGYLLLASSRNGREKAWRRRWVTLQGEVIHYYSSRTNAKERGRIYLRETTRICPYMDDIIDRSGNRVTRRLPNTQKLPDLSHKDEEIFYVIQIEIADKLQNHYLLACSTAERDSWLHALNKAKQIINEEEKYDGELTDLNYDGDQLFEELEEHPLPVSQVKQRLRGTSAQHLAQRSNWLNVAELCAAIEQSPQQEEEEEDSPKETSAPILYQCFGNAEGMRYRQVQLSASSISTEFVYILDAGATLYQWNGAKSSRLERIKALDMCMRLKYPDSRRAPEVVVIEEGKPGNEERFWVILREKGLPYSGEEDLLMHRMSGFGTARKTEMIKAFDSMIRLFHKSRPSCKRLYTKQCYVLDCFSEIFVWFGAQSKTTARLLASKVSRVLRQQSLDEGTRRPSWTTITHVIEDREPTLFKEMFSDFNSSLRLSQTYANISGGAEMEVPSIDMAAMFSSANLRLPPPVPAHAQGTADVWRLSEDKDKQATRETLAGQFWSKESYTVVHSYSRRRREKNTVYLWQQRGLNNNNPSSVGVGGGEQAVRPIDTRRTTLSAQMLWLDHDPEFQRKAANATQIRVTPYKEPAPFCALFPLPLIIHLGKRDKSKLETGHVDRLYELRRTNTSHRPFIAEKPVTVSSFSSRTAFLLFHLEAQGGTSSAFLWVGSHCPDEHVRMLADAAKRVWQGVLIRERVNVGGHNEPPVITLVKEDDAGEPFWRLVVESQHKNSAAEAAKQPVDFPTATSKPYYCPSMASKVPPRLFLWSEASNIEVEEMADFCQEDLCDESVGILDVATHIYLWFGSKARTYLKKTVSQVMQRYVTQANVPQPAQASIFVVKEYYEPADFISHFPAWKRLSFPDTAKHKALPQARGPLEHVLAEFARVTFSYEALLGDPLPSGIDCNRLETYLLDDEFLKVMKMTREEFYELPSASQDDRKRRVYL